MIKPVEGSAIEPHAELFPHGADVGVCGIGPTRDAAFEQVALALSSAITDPAHIGLLEAVEVTCEAPDDAYLLADWLNALIYEVAARRLVFGCFAVSIEGNRLYGRAWGEPIDHPRHMPAVEPKGATLTALKVAICDDGAWVAQCVVDVYKDITAVVEAAHLAGLSRKVATLEPHICTKG